jgi:hypothetical protein
MCIHFSCVRTKLSRRHGTKVHCIGESPTFIHRSKEKFIKVWWQDATLFVYFSKVKKENYAGALREKWALYRHEDLEIA